MSTPATQLKRLEARIPAHVKDAIERAAFLQGRTLTDFIIEVAGSKAREIIREHEIIHLSRADQIAFAEALLNPPEPNAKLKEAADWYRRETGR